MHLGRNSLIHLCITEITSILEDSKIDEVAVWLTAMTCTVCLFFLFLNLIASYCNPTFCLGKRFECAQIGELNIPPSNCYPWFCKVCLTSERNKKKRPAPWHQIKAPESREKGLLTCNISI